MNGRPGPAAIPSAGMDGPEHQFQVVEILGAGSFGTVVLAKPIDQERLVVIKVLRPELLAQPEILKRTRDEARLLARLHHPGIVAVERLTAHQGRPVVVMEYVDGADLGTLLRQDRAGLPAADALELVRRVAEALDAAWNEPSEAGRPLHVVHRDLKPTNVLLSRSGEVKVVDFGLARAEFDERETETEVKVMGSMGYMSPERFDTQVTGPSVDVYALGVTLVQLLTGRSLVLPRAGHRHDVELRRQLSHLAPPDLPAPVTEAVAALVTEMCAFDPTRRPTAGEVAARLAGLITGAGLAPDLPALARRIPRRAPEPPTRHDGWAEVSFLDVRTRGSAAPAPAIAPLPTAEAGPLRKLLGMLGLNPRKR